MEGRTIMTMVQPEIIAGIDTRHIAVVDTTDRKLGDAGFPATLIGYQATISRVRAGETSRR